MTLLKPLLLALLVGAMPAPARAALPPPPAGRAEPAEAPDAAAPATAEAAVTELQAIVVSGEMPGPGLWQVERDGRVLWVIATVSPLPKRMEWNADEVTRRVRESGVVLLSPSVSLSVGGSRFRALLLVPSLLKARNNPDDARLADVLPPDDLARWQRLKARWLGRDRGVEKRRPILAGIALRDAALDRVDLSGDNVVGETVERAARRADVETRTPSVGVVVEDPKATLREFRASTLDDLPCFRRTLDQVENDLDTLALRANAWALGDVAMLDRLPYTDNVQTCMDALMGTGLARDSGLDEVPVRIAAEWVREAEAALAAHPQSFAVLPLRLVTGPESYLSMLEARGYTVRGPGAGHTMPP